MTSAPSAQAPGQVFAPERPLHGRLIIRDAQATDMVHIQRIYAHQVLHGTDTFEVTPPSLQEILERREKVLEQDMPYLLATLHNREVGDCYGSLYPHRIASRYHIEDSFYSEQGETGQSTAQSQDE